MQGAEERRLRRMKYTPQGGAIEGNAADDTLMVDQGRTPFIDNHEGIWDLLEKCS